MNRRLFFLFPVLLLFATAMPLHSQEPGAVNATTAPNTQQMKTDLLVVTAHPDDESMMAATMARYADEGRVVSLVVCTQGEGGGNSTGKESGAALGVVREAELRRCLALLGTRYLYFLNQPDWAYTESVQATLAKWGHEETLRRLVRLVRVLKPEVIATMDPAPVGGQHGHHQAAGRLATEAFEAAADPKAFPELLEEEGLVPWRASKLYWTGGGPNSRTEIATDGVTHGSLATVSPGKRYADIAGLAESNHRSQGFDKYFSRGPSGGAPAAARPERFILVKSRAAGHDPGQDETDLFADVQSGPSASRKEPLAAIAPRPSPTQTVTAQIQPGPAVRNYRSWLHVNGLDRLMMRLPAQVPITIGAASPVVVEVSNRAASASPPQQGRVVLNLPPGWRSDVAAKPFSVAAGATTPITFRVTAPASVRIASYDVSVQIEGDEAHDAAADGAAGKMNALPQMRVRRLAHLPPVDADVQKWEAARISPHAILPTNTAQGAAATAAEASGRFFVAYDSAGIQVLVDVTDDMVVSNIAPDDIKAHWRSTSTEICIDPFPRAENTMRTLKLGIFPADTSGQVRAARDADANPGPVDRKEPSLRLASRRTTGGYVVEARIPWAALLRTSLAFRPSKGRRLGFNVILYHAGKRDARVGEDINKSRLAWSFWDGVWGRPEVWGTAVLE